MKILLTGTAGFIGMHTAAALMEKENKVIGIDNMNDYYDVSLKQARLEQLDHNNFRFIKGDISNKSFLMEIVAEERPDAIITLAAQAGVRYSIENPDIYLQSNIVGFNNILEVAKEFGIQDVVYASSSSVYGGNKDVPFSENQSVDKPISLYAATKKANELQAHTYSHLFGINTTGLRFFTVYGPWGRPDMAAFKFADLMKKGKTIDIYNHGKMKRDFTYVDDIVDGILSSLDTSGEKTYRIFNLGNDNPEGLMTMIELLEKNMGMEAKKNFMKIQPGDVPETWADISKARSELLYDPKTSLSEGIEKFSNWYGEYYGN